MIIKFHNNFKANLEFAETPNEPSLPTYKVAGFFSGVGGIERAFAQAGWNVVWSNEIDAHAVTTLLANVEHQVVHDDIYNIEAEDIPEIDALVGGFPCQAFSIAGEQRGFQDERGVVFFRLIRIIACKLPRVICLENVSNLQTHDKGRTYEIISTSLRKLGYKLHTLILNSTEYGNIPQNRKRIYICGFLQQRDWQNFISPQPQRLRAHVSDFVDFEQQVADKYYYTPEKHSYYPELARGVTQIGKIYQWRRKYVRENKMGVCPTLTANMGVGGNNVPIIRTPHGIRKLTPRECFRLQGFTDDFILPNIADSHLYKQAGNSVVIPVVRAVAQAILEAVRKTDRESNFDSTVTLNIPSLNDMYIQMMEQDINLLQPFEDGVQGNSAQNLRLRQRAWDWSSLQQLRAHAHTIQELFCNLPSLQQLAIQQSTMLKESQVTLPDLTHATQTINDSMQRVRRLVTSYSNACDAALFAFKRSDIEEAIQELTEKCLTNPQWLQPEDSLTTQLIEQQLKLACQQYEKLEKNMQQIMFLLHSTSQQLRRLEQQSVQLVHELENYLQHTDAEENEVSLEQLPYNTTSNVTRETLDIVERKTKDK